MKSVPAQRQVLKASEESVVPAKDDPTTRSPCGDVSAGGSAAAGAGSGCRALAGRLDRRLQPACDRRQRLSHASLDRALVGRRSASTDARGGQRHPTGVLTRRPVPRLHLGSRRSGAALDLAARRRRAAPGGRYRGRCQGRAVVARWATVADHGAQRRRAPGCRRSGGPDCARHRRLRLEARQDRFTQSIGERVGGSGR